MPTNIHLNPPNTMVLDAYATPNVSTLKPLFPLLFNLIFPASKA
jgi:hypothetical protein